MCVLLPFVALIFEPNSYFPRPGKTLAFAYVCIVSMMLIAKMKSAHILQLGVVEQITTVKIHYCSFFEAVQRDGGIQVKHHRRQQRNRI